MTGMVSISSTLSLTCFCARVRWKVTRPRGVALKLRGAEDHVEFDEVFVDTGAGAEFDAVADLLPEGIEGVGGTKAMCSALRVFAACEVAAIGAHLYCSLKLHVEAR
jgi:hypothetical protein